MRRHIKIEEPSAELQAKIINACTAAADLKSRIINCPYCRHKAIIVFEDARGHVQTKCKVCGREVVFDVLHMRRERQRSQTKANPCLRF